MWMSVGFSSPDATASACALSTAAASNFHPRVLIWKKNEPGWRCTSSARTRSAPANAATVALPVASTTSFAVMYWIPSSVASEIFQPSEVRSTPQAAALNRSSTPAFSSVSAASAE